MSNRSNELFLGPAFKKWYIIITVVICLLWTLVSFGTYLFGNNNLLSADLFGYYNAFLVVFVVTGMIIDEKIRKYPGLVITIVSAIYYFCYIVLCMLRADCSLMSVMFSIAFLLYIGCSYLIYKFIIPRIVVLKYGPPIFNTTYLMITLTVTLVLGFIC
ncbi:MAG: hypothetical protein R3Y05_04475 [bacterium]